ncbi:MAG: hypothetical protein V1798_09100 [Pseudomonadota bacterium]
MVVPSGDVQERKLKMRILGCAMAFRRSRDFVTKRAEGEVPFRPQSPFSGDQDVPFQVLPWYSYSMSSKAYPLSEKLAISLPRSLLMQVEKFRKKTGETRSSLFQRAIRLFLDSHIRKDKIEQYVTGYSRHPETADEIKAAEAAASYLLAEEPWE